MNSDLVESSVRSDLSESSSALGSLELPSLDLSFSASASSLLSSDSDDDLSAGSLASDNSSVVDLGSDSELSELSLGSDLLVSLLGLVA